MSHSFWSPMKFRLFVLIMALLLMMNACGGGGGGKKPQPEPAVVMDPPVVVADPIVVADPVVDSTPTVLAPTLVFSRKEPVIDLVSRTGSVEIEWVATNATVCKRDDNVTRPTTGSEILSGLWADLAYSIRMYCIGDGGQVDKFVDINFSLPPLVVTPPPAVLPLPPSPTAILSASQTSIPYNGLAMLSWSSTNATSCSGNWGTSIGITGSAAIVNITGPQVYKVICKNAVGVEVASNSVTITVGSDPALQPINVLVACDGIGASISRDPQGFVKVGRCKISPEKKIGVTEISVILTGFSRKVLEMRVMAQDTATSSDCLERVFVEVARAPLVGEEAKLVFSNFDVSTCTDSSVWGSPNQRVERDVVFEALFAPLESLGVTEQVRDAHFAIKEGGVKTVEKFAVFSNTFPLQVGFVRMEKGNALSSGNSLNTVYRVDAETGIGVPIWYSDYVFHNGGTVSSDGTIMVFSTSNGPGLAVMSLDGTGCTITDITTGPMSPECNKGYHGVGFKTSPGGSGDISPDNKFVVRTDTSVSSTVFGQIDKDIWLSQISGAGISQLTKDVYVDLDPHFSLDGTEVYFVSCRPFDDPMAPYNPSPFVPYAGGCGVFKRGVDLTTGDPVGPVKYVMGKGEDWGNNLQMGGVNIGMAISPNGQKILISRKVSGVHTLFVRNIDGTGVREIGKGRGVSWRKEGRIFFSVDSPDGLSRLVIADPDGSNKRSSEGYPYKIGRLY